MERKGKGWPGGGGLGKRVAKGARRQRQLMAAGILSLSPSYGNSTAEAGILKHFTADSVC